jgi:putative membrane fusion protein
MPSKSTKKRKARRKATPRFYLTLGAIAVVLVIVIFLIVRGPRQMTLAEGEIDFSRNVETTLVRDETLNSVSDYMKVDFFVTEGQSVAKGTKIADIYKTSLNEKTITDLATLQQNIKEYQENTALKGVVNNEITEKNKQINNRMQEISDVVTGKSDADLVSLERKMIELMQQKSELLKQYSSTNHSELNAMYQQEADLKKKIAEGTEAVSASEAGIVSFNLDGFEGVLVPDALESLTKQDLDNAKKGIKTEKKEDEQEGKKPLYRLVNNFRWYCVIYAEQKNTISEIRENELFQLHFEAMDDKPYEAKVIKVRDMEEGGKLYILEMGEDIGPLLSVRFANVTMKKKYTGIKVPLNALYDEDGKKQIKLVNNDKSVQPVEVEVLIQDDENAIIQSKNAEVSISVGQNIMTR